MTDEDEYRTEVVTSDDDDSSEILESIIFGRRDQNERTPIIVVR